METSAPDTQLPAGDGNRRGWAAGISLGIAGLVMILLLVLPGFLAAGFSRMDTDYLSVNGWVVWDNPRFAPPKGGKYRTEFLVLVPSGWVMTRSQFVRRFYSWEYKIAGGLNSVLVK